MLASRPLRTSRRFWIGAALVGGFLVLDLALFAWLIFRSLSQRELDRILLETRQEAQELAGRIHEGAQRTGGDLFTAVALEQETQTYIDSALRQRLIVQTVEITDHDGVLVMRQRFEREVATPGTPLVPEPELVRAGGQVETRTVERRQERALELPPVELASLEVSVPIGGFGSLRIGLSAFEINRRIALLRRELVRQTAIIGGLTALIVAGAVLFISMLIRRGERLEAQASEAERLAYVGTLAAGLAHEIRNPLNSLNLNMQMLEEDLPPSAGGDTSRRLLSITRAEIGRLERLVSEFLAYARPRPLKLEETPAIDLLISAREVLAAQILQADAAVRLVDESYEASVRVDAEQIQQLLLNLLQNALHAAEGSGRKPEVALFVRREGGQVEIEVRDNGRGIPPADRERIFDAFFSTRKGGTGLGLAIAQRIARAHGGRLTVDSDLDFGSKFVLSLPLAESPADLA